MKHKYYSLLKFIFVITFSTLASGLCHATDTIPPVINLRTAGTVYVTVKSVYISVMPTATDNVSDSSKIIITKSSDVDTDFTGIYYEIFTATDESNNSSSKTRIVIVSRDLTPPVIKLLGPDTVFHERGVPYISQGVVATDNMDGNVTNAIVKIFSDVNVNIVGLYKEIFKATDVAGNSAEATQYVKISEPTNTNSVLLNRTSLISISPNPAKDQIRINMANTSANTKLSIISMDSKIIMETDKYHNNSLLYIGELEPGIYFLVLNDNLRSYYSKLVVE
jgi:hypothetical protein